jgi:ribonucleoside-triphosphate reductase
MQELPTLYQQQISKTKYARWREDLGRRETWSETVDRFMEFVQKHLTEKFTPLLADEYTELREAIFNCEVSPSMRAMMTAGVALERDNVAAYNCAFLDINRVKAFSEVLYILCCGTGVGYSVERQHINKLPDVPDEFYPSPTTIVVPDSKIGWATSFQELLSLLYAGKVPQIDYSKVRPAGSPLKTFGGRASGPGPLKELFEYTIGVFRNAAGRKLTSVEVHGIICKIGDIVVVGGVRRSALISLFNPSDERMLNAKTGEFPGHFHLVNNSAAWTEKPEVTRFMDKWKTLIDSKSGEPGIFNREAAIRKCESIGRDGTKVSGTNPCGEIILRDRQFCNLTEVTVRAYDDYSSLRRKVELATILGTIQSTFTDFRYLSKKWKENCEEERLLGVSFTGIMDNEFLSGRDPYADWEVGGGTGANLPVVLGLLRLDARQTNEFWAERLGINPAAAITCGKPSGNNGERLQTASGIHARFAKYYIRRNRMNKTDPVAQLLYMMGVPCEDEIFHPDTTWVFSWPQKAPEGAVTRRDRTAVQQLEHWLTFVQHWCDHNQSVTINVKEEEWLDVAAFVYKHWDRMIGVTFLPESDHIYQQAPYEECTRDEYNALLEEIPESVDWSLLSAYESSDQTESAKTLACVSGACEI